jgi:hypothetical protein
VGTGLGKIVDCLEIQPELRARAESLAQKPGGVWGNPALSANQLIYPLSGHSDMGGQLNLRDAQGNEKFLKEDLSGVSGGTV